MKTLLITGVDGVVGANIAAHLSETCRVVGLSESGSVSIEGCEIRSASQHPDQILRDVNPDQVIHTGPLADSCWQPSFLHATKTVTEARTWAEATAATETPFTLISSDGLFTSPWMFHEEDSEGVCSSPESQIVQDTETKVLTAHPQTLVIRTNAYGWSPQGDQGWLEQLISELEENSEAHVDYVRHATPILATDLAQILSRAWEEKLTGTYHIAGAERVNPARFVRYLATEFNLPFPRPTEGGVLMECPDGYGCGETSLQTLKIRKALCVAMPTLAEGLDRLLQQQENGYRERLCGANEVVARVA